MFNENQKKIAFWVITLNIPVVLATTFMLTHMNVFYARMLDVAQVGTSKLVVTVLLAVIGIILAKDSAIQIARSMLKTVLLIEIALTCIAAYFVLVDPYTALILSAVVAGVLFPIKKLGFGAEFDLCFRGELRTKLNTRRSASDNIAAAIAAVIVMVFNEIPVEALAVSIAVTCILSNLTGLRVVSLLRKENMKRLE